MEKMEKDGKWKKMERKKLQKNISLLPHGPFLHIFKYVDMEDLGNLQQVCSTMLIENEKRNEIENDWRLKFIKNQKFNTKISATKAIASLERAEAKKGNYSIRGSVIPHYHGLQDIGKTVFNEVTTGLKTRFKNTVLIIVNS